jgi:hypothetical protein
LAKQVIPEEIQHIIQARSGFALGTSPADEVLFPEYWRALGKPIPSDVEAAQVIRQHQDIINRGMNDKAQRGTPEYQAAEATYKRVAGEAEGQNASNRAHNDLYSQHPMETLGFPPSEQIVRSPEWQRQVVDDFFNGVYFRQPPVMRRKKP